MIELLTIESVSFIGVLLVAIVALWRMNISYNKQAQEEAAEARQTLMDTLNEQHGKTRQLLKGQNEALSRKAEMLNEQLTDEKERRDKEQREYILKMEEITSGYRVSLETFNKSMDATQAVLQEVQSNMKEQTALLREMAGIPQQVDKIAKDVNALWERQRENEGKA